MRIVHLLARDADFESLRGAEQLRDGLGDDFQCAIQTMTPGIGGVIRAMRRPERKSGGLDCIHAWGGAALAAALWFGGPVIYSPPAILSRTSAGWLRAVMEYRDIRIVCATSTQHQRFLNEGIDPDRCLLIRPGVDFAQLKTRRDAETRRRLGLAEDDFVLLLAGETTRPANHLQGMWSVGILHVLDRRYKVVMWGRGPMAESLRRHGVRMGAAEALCFADQRLGRVDFQELLPAADMVLAPAGGPVRTIEIAMAMGAGLPIIATAGPTVSELLEDRHTALMTPRPDPRLIAGRVLELRDDPALQRSLGDRARAEAHDYFSRSRFLEEYRKVYEAAAR